MTGSSSDSFVFFSFFGDELVTDCLVNACIIVLAQQYRTLSNRTQSITETAKISEPVATCEVTMIESEKPLLFEGKLYTGLVKRVNGH